MSEARGWIPKTGTTFYDVAIMQNILHMSIYLSGPLLSSSLFRKLYLAEIPIQGPFAGDAGTLLAPPNPRPRVYMDPQQCGHRCLFSGRSHLLASE